MREIDAKQITDAVRNLCIDANKNLPKDLEETLRNCKETSQTGISVMKDICANLDAAKELNLPICQDTGMAVVFAEIGQEVHICGNFEDAVNEGVRRGYTEGLLRCSVVKDPLRRQNTGDNTPAVLHTRLVAGDKITLTVAPKGFGSENMSSVVMLKPSASREDVINTVTEIMKAAGGNPCPPVVLGVGIGGDFELCALLAKKALCRSVSKHNPDSYYADLERDMLKAVNELQIGPQGFGGITTAVAVNIETYPTHIAGLPVAVNVGCHVTRHKKITI